MGGRHFGYLSPGDKAVPKISKAERREAKRRRAQKNETMGVRTSTLRAGLSLIKDEVVRKTRLKKPRKK